MKERVIVRALCEAKADINQADNDGTTLVCIASLNGRFDIIRALCELKADINLAMNDGATPVMIASYKRHLDTVRALCEAKADINQARNSGATPVYIASQKGHVDTVRALCEVKADINQARNDGVTPVMSALQRRHVSVALVLLQHELTWPLVRLVHDPVSSAVLIELSGIRCMGATTTTPSCSVGMGLNADNVSDDVCGRMSVLAGSAMLVIFCVMM